ncbi:hypothetical protein RhiirA5_500610 [Rhizophagus irregularis]|uniref:Uncharacterized protein n=1 Tax=Rhizophagus irregularis TaxID=588596 RepID=A0A2I1EA11_9GLOM|nr:hypothetical protein RhiirA5_500610 [Rhizophagus irregularis]PKC63838.1 hypothetical protein RhiirA1_463229 [Rhizophagus irregularis]PKY18967.1 hypothetical protein RhiirB3_523169 [Rhizophagus irregularis]
MLTRIASREVGQDKDKDKDVAHFGKAFGKSLNLEHIPFTAQLMKKVLGDNVDRRPNWRRALEAFKNAGTVYKTKHNKLPVIVYDNISGLINTNPKVLDTLQDDAKMDADYREYIAVFVSTRSAWSRAKHPVIEIGDLSNEESMKYLTEKRKINEVEAKKFHKQSILAEVEKKFNTVQLLRKQLYHEVGKKAIKALLDSKELDFTTFMKFFDNYEEADKSNNVREARMESVQNESTRIDSGTDLKLKESGSLRLETTFNHKNRSENTSRTGSN